MNDYFSDSFNGNEASWKKWKEVFDVLGIAKSGGGSIETQVLGITNSEDLVKLRALAELCSNEFFDDKSLLVVAWRRIMEVLEMRKKVGEVKGEKEEGGARELEILDACAALGTACGFVGNFGDAERFYKRVKEGYEEHLGPDDAKTLDATHSFILSTNDDGRRTEKFRDLVKRFERALGDENVVTLRTLNALGGRLIENKQYEEAKEVHEGCLAGRMKVLGEDHKLTLLTLNNLGIVYKKLENNEKALESHERALKGKEKTLGENHPDTLGTVMNIANIYKRMEDYGKAEELYQRALMGYEAQLGIDHKHTKICARNFSICLEDSGNSKRLAGLEEAYPRLYENGFVHGESEEDESDDEDEGDY
ncbi:hypothetical protein TL16_g12290 [Triparma laevis f. inornata]|uniref:Kinesin light chain n=1 Tax=Triparma laevis f. inornata TaxID=1714386 RepID=A0A9W7BJA3_9STRA|nr:hypothetical protein TL16_g12290 [Triparma laevis f. inornata]